MAAWPVGFMAPKPPKGSSRSKLASARAEEQAKIAQARTARAFRADRIILCGLIIWNEPETGIEGPGGHLILTRLWSNCCSFEHLLARLGRRKRPHNLMPIVGLVGC